MRKFISQVLNRVLDLTIGSGESHPELVSKSKELIGSNSEQGFATESLMKSLDHTLVSSPPPELVTIFAGRSDNSWTVENVDKGSYLVTSPGGIPLKISSEIDWNQIPEEQYQTTLLWLYSLRYLPMILDEFGDIETAHKIAVSFSSWLLSKQGILRFQHLSSKDHLIAELIISLLQLSSCQQIYSEELVKKLFILAVTWSTDTRNVAPNNHGLMVASSVLLSSPIFQERNTRDELQRYAEEELLDVLGEIFDETGLCLENSPSYHFFYIRHLRRLANDLLNLHQPSLYPLIDQIGSIADRAEGVLDHIVLPDGRMPPLGDGNLHTYKAASEIEQSNSDYFSSAGGLFVRRSPRSYFSLKAGMGSVTHKHLDDTSIYFWFDGIPIFTDSGLYNYDSSDQKTITTKGQRGHSGAFYTKFDNLYPGQAYQSVDLLFSGTLTIQSVHGNQTHLKANSTIDDQLAITRSVLLIDQTNFILTDSFTTTSESRVVRFLIPQENFVTIRERATIIENAKCNVEIQSTIPSGKSITPCFYPAKLEKPEQNENAQAFQARAFGKLEPCHLLEFEVPLGVDVLTTTVRLIEKSH